MLDNMKRDNPKQFYKIFRKKRKTCKSYLNVKDFFQYFSNLMSVADIETQHTDETHCDFNELDEDFTDEGIREQIRNLKKDKAPGIDGLLNEMFVKCEAIFLPVLKNCLIISYQPECTQNSCLKGIVIPVYQKGDDSDTGNYRPITLISHLAKLFTSVLKGCTAYCLNFSEFQKNQLLLQIFPKIDKRMKFTKVMFSVNVVVSFV